VCTNTPRGNPTLTRFYALHFLLPFVIAALVVMHLISLHEHASNNPLGISSKSDRVPFYPYFLFKDIVGFFAFFLVLSIFVFFFPNVLGHSDNYVMANPLSTPSSIVPECISTALPARKSRGNRSLSARISY